MAPQDPLPELPGPEDVAALQLTSGTTGFPRICVWRQRAVLAALDGMVEAMELGPEDRLLNWTPLYHDMGLVNNFLLALVHGLPLALMTPTDFLRRPGSWLRGLAETGATHTWSPNFGYALAARRVREEELEGVSLAGVEAFWNAAERIHADTYRRFLDRFRRYGVTRSALRTNYGCAENVGGATFGHTLRVERLDCRALHEDGVARVVEESPDGDGDAPPPEEVVGAGRPYPGLTLRILDREGRELPEGRVGEVALDSPSRLER